MTIALDTLRKPIELTAIVWPVFRLGEHKPTVEDGVVFYSKEYVDKDSTDSFIGFRLVDDKTVDAPTLGLRRLQLKYKLDQSKLFPITRAIYFLVDLIKLAKPTTWFIDNHGNLFQNQGKLVRNPQVAGRKLVV